MSNTKQNTFLHLPDSSHCCTEFSQHLFWDVDPSGLDWEKNRSQIIKRVLEYGLLRDWLLLERYYGLDTIVETVKGLRSLDPRALSFIAALSGTPKASFRCYITRQSSLPYWHF